MLLQRFPYLLIAGLLSGFASYAQNTVWPASTSSDNVGIGTSNPVSKFQVYGGNATLWGITLGLGIGNAVITTDDNSKPISFQIAGNEAMRVDNTGNIGIGLPYPQAKLHLLSNGSSSNSTAQYSGDVIVQGGSIGRSSVTGASIEFVIPANADGNNPWGQARIISVAGNGNSYDATGKLILGTRRMFDKGTGSGMTWNYGDDIVIDGAGKIGIGTVNPDTKLTVNGTIHAKEVKVDTNIPVPDYVFNKDYLLIPLTDVEKYIRANKHLPEIPSANVMEKEGINLSDMNLKLLKKVEELTLYLIEKDNQLKRQQQQIKAQEARLVAIENLTIKKTNK